MNLLTVSKCKTQEEGKVKRRKDFLSLCVGIKEEGGGLWITSCDARCLLKSKLYQTEWDVIIISRLIDVVQKSSGCIESSRFC